MCGVVVVRWIGHGDCTRYKTLVSLIGAGEVTYFGLRYRFRSMDIVMRVDRERRMPRRVLSHPDF